MGVIIAISFIYTALIVFRATRRYPSVAFNFHATIVRGFERAAHTVILSTNQPGQAMGVIIAISFIYTALIVFRATRRYPSVAFNFHATIVRGFERAAHTVILSTNQPG